MEIILSNAEIQSSISRVDWAEGLILQLPITHAGRTLWLINYGNGDEAKKLRNLEHIEFDCKTKSAKIVRFIQLDSFPLYNKRKWSCGLKIRTFK
jgi:hypothetical protein